MIHDVLLLRGGLFCLKHYLGGIFFFFLAKEHPHVYQDPEFSIPTLFCSHDQ